MDNLIYIDDFFAGEKTGEKKQDFENRILNDKNFAEEVAFYLSASSAIKEEMLQEKKERFREIYQQKNIQPAKYTATTKPMQKIWRMLAAACIVGLVALGGWWMFSKNETPQQYAAQYIQQNMENIGVSMGNGQDSMQVAIGFFKAGKLNEALTYFESVVKQDSTNNTAKKYAGIAFLRLEKYEQALQHFHALASDTALYSNPGKFYEAITLLKRNQLGDEQKAKKLLQQVVEKALDGKEDALVLLKKIGR